MAHTTPPARAKRFDLQAHLANLDHGQLASLLGDARLVELVTAVMQSRTGVDIAHRGKLILDVVGGAEAIFEDTGKRRNFFLSLSGKERGALASALEASSIDRFNLTSERREKLYQWFGLTAPSRAPQEISPGVVAVNVQYGLFPHQTSALLRCLEFLNSSVPMVMLHMPTGSGKTRTAMHLICRHLNRRAKGLVLWLVSGKELCEQASSEFLQAWQNLGERPLPLIHAWEGRNAVDQASFAEGQASKQLNPKEFAHSIWPEGLADGVIIGSLDTIWGMLQRWEPAESSRRASNVSLIVFDEAHRSAAKTYSAVIDSIRGESHCGVIGLSATPGRSHYGNETAETKTLVELFGKQKVQLKIEGFASPVEALIAQGYLAKLKKERLQIADAGLSKKELASLNKQLENALELPDETLRYLGLSATRNLQIIERVERLARDENHRRIIVFAPSVESSHLIASVLKSRGIEAASVTSKTEGSLRAALIARFKAEGSTPFVLCNYGVLTTGFDAPKTSAVVIARPTLSIVLLNQMAGRAIRGPLVGGNKEALLITVVDTAIPQLVDTVNQFHAFDTDWKTH